MLLSVESASSPFVQVPSRCSSAGSWLTIDGNPNQQRQKNTWMRPISGPCRCEGGVEVRGYQEPYRQNGHRGQQWRERENIRGMPPSFSIIGWSNPDAFAHCCSNNVKPHKPMNIVGNWFEPWARYKRPDHQTELI